MRVFKMAGLLVGILSPLAHAQPLRFVDGLPGTFVDITNTGTALDLADEGWRRVTTSVGNAVFPAGQLVVHNNGGIGFAIPPGEETLSPLNQPIPSNDAFNGNQALLCFWDDIGNDIGIGNVYFAETPEMAIIQWQTRQFHDSSDTVTLQVQLPAAGSIALRATPVYARFLYADVLQPRADGGGSATIGYQDGAAGFNDTQWSFNQPSAVVNGTVLSLTIPEPASGGFLVALVGGVLARRRHTQAR